MLCTSMSHTMELKQSNPLNIRNDKGQRIDATEIVFSPTTTPQPTSSITNIPPALLYEDEYYDTQGSSTGPYSEEMERIRNENMEKYREIAIKEEIERENREREKKVGFCSSHLCIPSFLAGMMFLGLLAIPAVVGTCYAIGGEHLCKPFVNGTNY